jgi:hypothetical protein
LTTCSEDEYVSVIKTDFTDRVCSTITSCTADEFELTRPTEFENRVCKLITSCGSNEYIAQNFTNTTNNVCTLLTSCSYTAGADFNIATLFSEYNPECKTDSCEATTAEQFAYFADTLYESTAATLYSDRVCTPTTVCVQSDYIQIVGTPTATTDRECAKINHCGLEGDTVECSTDHSTCVDGFKVGPNATERGYTCACDEGWHGRDCDCNEGTTYSEAGANIMFKGQMLSPCKPLQTCTDDEWEVTPATLASDRTCIALTTCTVGQFESQPKTATSDRECIDYSPECRAEDDLIEVAGTQTPTSDRLCEPIQDCDNGGSDKCTHEFQTIGLGGWFTGENYKESFECFDDHPVTGLHCGTNVEGECRDGFVGRYCGCKHGLTYSQRNKADGVFDYPCVQITACDASQYQKEPSTDFTDRVCEDLSPPCGEDSYIYTNASRTNDHVCALLTICGSTYHIEKNATLHSDRVCGSTTTTTTTATTTTTTTTKYDCLLDCGGHGECVLTRAEGACDDETAPYDTPRCMCDHSPDEQRCYYGQSTSNGETTYCTKFIDDAEMVPQTDFFKWWNTAENRYVGSPTKSGIGAKVKLSKITPANNWCKVPIWERKKPYEDMLAGRAISAPDMEQVNGQNGCDFDPADHVERETMSCNAVGYQGSWKLSLFDERRKGGVVFYTSFQKKFGVTLADGTFAPPVPDENTIYKIETTRQKVVLYDGSADAGEGAIITSEQGYLVRLHGERDRAIILNKDSYHSNGFCTQANPFENTTVAPTEFPTTTQEPEITVAPMWRDCQAGEFTEASCAGPNGLPGNQGVCGSCDEGYYCVLAFSDTRTFEAGGLISSMVGSDGKSGPCMNKENVFGKGTFVQASSAEQEDKEGSTRSLDSVGAIFGVIALVGALIAAIMYKKHAMHEQEQAEKSGSTVAESNMDASALDKLAPYASGAAPVSALTARGDALWMDFRKVTAFDNLYFGNTLFTLTDTALEDVYALLQVPCPPRSHFSPLREVGKQFLEQTASRGARTSGPTPAPTPIPTFVPTPAPTPAPTAGYSMAQAGGGAGPTAVSNPYPSSAFANSSTTPVEDDTVDFATAAMADFLLERAIDLLAILSAHGTDVDDSAYEAFYEMVSKYDPSQNGFLCPSLGNAGGMGMRPDAARRSLTQAEPIYYQAESDYATVNKALGNGYAGLYDAAGGGEALYDAANRVGESAYDRAQAGAMYDRAESDLTFNHSLPSSGYARAAANAGEATYDSANSRAASGGYARASATDDVMYDAPTADGYSMAASSGYARANATDEVMYDAPTADGYSMAASSGQYDTATATGEVTYDSANTGSGYARAASGGYARANASDDVTYDAPGAGYSMAASGGQYDTATATGEVTYDSAATGADYAMAGVYGNNEGNPNIPEAGYAMAASGDGNAYVAKSRRSSEV